MSDFMRLHVAVLALLSLLLVSPLLAQDRILPPLVERIEVTVVNVEAIVTDRDGKRVTGLTKDDFELFENGKRQKITNFYEVAAPEAGGSIAVAGGHKPTPTNEESVGSPRQPLRLAVVVDQRHLIFFSRERVLSQVRSFVQSSMREGDEAMLAVWDLRLTVPVSFTSDPKPVVDGLTRIGLGLGPSLDKASETMQRELEVQQALDAELAAKRGVALIHGQENALLALETRIEMRRKVAALRAVIRRMAGMEGRKVLLFVTQKFPYCATPTFAPCPADENLQPLVDTVSADANANGVALYTVYAAPNDLEMNSAERKRPATPVELANPMARDLQSRSALHEMALASGGVSTTGPELASYFSAVQSDLDSYYSLGYSATRGTDAKTRAIRVVTKNPQYRVRTRKSVVEKSASDQLSDQLVSYLFDADTPRSGSLAFEVTLGTPKPEKRGRYLVPAGISISVRDLTLMEKGSAFRGGFFIHFVTVDERGDLSDTTHRQHRLDVPPNDLEKVRASTFVYSLELLVDPRGRRVAVAVADEISGLTGMQIVDLPPLPVK